MEVNTNDINVVKYQIAYELCQPIDVIDGKHIDERNVDKYAIEKAKLINKVVGEL